MKITKTKVGALALASMLFAGSFGVAGSGAIAQDQAQQIGASATAEMVQSDATASNNAAQPQVRFVTSEVVQDIPAEPEEQDIGNTDAASLSALVASIDTNGPLSPEMMCLAQAVYFEARGEPLDGQLAVARVIINRSESSAFPDDYCSVVTQPSQFSFVRGGSIPTPREGTAAWNRAKAIARIAHRDLWDSPVDDALYFHATHVRPRWANRMTTRAQIDNHIFYR